VATLTISLQRGNGPLTRRDYSRAMDSSGTWMRRIVALTGAVTVLLLVLPIHQ